MHICQPTAKRVCQSLASSTSTDESDTLATSLAFELRSTIRSQRRVEGAPANVVYDVAVPASATLDILLALPPGGRADPEADGRRPGGEHGRSAIFVAHSGFIAAINFQLRFAPYVLAARSLIEQQASSAQIHDMEVRVNVETPWHLWSFSRRHPAPRNPVSQHPLRRPVALRFWAIPSGVYAKTVRYPGLDRLAATRTTMALDYGDFLRATITTNHHHVWGARSSGKLCEVGRHDGRDQGDARLVDRLSARHPRCVRIRDPGGRQPGPWRAIPVEGSWFPDAFIGTMSSLQRYPKARTPRYPPPSRTPITPWR